MLVLAKSIKELDFRLLMEVYQQENEKRAEDEWANLPRGFALEMAEQNFHRYLTHIFFPTPGSVYAMWEIDGRYVSALRLEPYKDGLLLEGLETAPEERKKGYAAALIRFIQQMLKQQGSFKLYSHVEKKNLASLRTHQACGFQEISDHAVFIDGSVNYRACTLCYVENKSPCS